MKTLYFFLAMIGCCNISVGQITRFNKKDSAKIMDVKYIQNDLDCAGKSSLTKKLPFRRMIFFDVRYDTSFIAISYEPLSAGYILSTKCDIKNGLEASFSKYFMDFFTGNFSNTNAELLCYIKRFSIIPKGTMVAMTHGGNSNESPNNITFEAECYYHVYDTLYPAARIDTSYTQRSEPLKKSYLEVTEKTLQLLVEKLRNIDSLKIRKRNPYTLQQIHDRYQSRFNLAILKDSVYKKGIYRSFKDFINNTPSIAEFTVENKRFTTSFFDSNGAKINPPVFGFCDGETCWLYWAGYCAPLIRIGNSFEYFRTLLVSNSFGIATAHKFLAVLDMENK